MITVYIALGTNIGEREENLRAALRHLPEVGVHIRRVSSVYETEPLDYLDQDWFLNAVLEAQTELAPSISSAPSASSRRKWAARKPSPKARVSSISIFSSTALKPSTRPSSRSLIPACSTANSSSSRSRKSLPAFATRLGPPHAAQLLATPATTAKSKNPRRLLHLVPQSIHRPISAICLPPEGAAGRSCFGVRAGCSLHKAEPPSPRSSPQGNVSSPVREIQLVFLTTSRCNVITFGSSASNSICDNPPASISLHR